MSIDEKREYYMNVQLLFFFLPLSFFFLSYPSLSSSLARLHLLLFNHSSIFLFQGIHKNTS